MSMTILNLAPHRQPADLGQTHPTEEIVVSFLSLARWMAALQIQKGWTQNDYDDLVSCAMMAAQKACERCSLPQCVRENDPTARCHYAFARMTGAILDFMREADPMTRWGRREVKQGKRLPVTLEQVDASTCAYRPNYAARLDAQKALDALPPRVRTIFEMYVQGYSTTEIASRFRLSQGRISQLYGTALLQMRKRLVDAVGRSPASGGEGTQGRRKDYDSFECLAMNSAI